MMMLVRTCQNHSFYLMISCFYLTGCGIYQDIPLPQPAEGEQPAVEDPAQNDGKVAALSEANGVSKFKIKIRGAAQTIYRAESSGEGKAKGAVISFNKDSFAKDFDLIIEPAELPLSQMRAELGTSSSVQLITPMIHFGTTPLTDPGGTVNLGIPLANGPAHPLFANFAVLGLVTNMGEGGTSEILWISKDKLKFSASKVTFQATKFGIYGVVAVDPPLKSSQTLTSKRLPAQYGLSNLYRLTLTGLPKPAEGATSTPSGSYPLSPDVTMKSTVTGPGITEYKFELRGDRVDCKDATYSKWTPVKKAITLKLAENGVKTLCAIGKNAEGRETGVFQYTWIKQTPKSFLSAEGTNTIDFSDQTSKTVTLNVKGAKAKSLKVSGLGNGFQFLGGKFPGTGGTCKKGGEDKTCTLVFSLKSTTEGTYSTAVLITYNNGSEDKTLNLTFKATL